MQVSPTTAVTAAATPSTTSRASSSQAAFNGFGSPNTGAATAGAQAAQAGSAASGQAGAASTATPAQPQAGASDAQAAARPDMRIATMHVSPNATTSETLNALAGAMNSPNTGKDGLEALRQFHQMILEMHKNSLALWTQA